MNYETIPTDVRNMPRNLLEDEVVRLRRQVASLHRGDITQYNVPIFVNGFTFIDKVKEIFLNREDFFLEIRDPRITYKLDTAPNRVQIWHDVPLPTHGF